MITIYNLLAAKTARTAQTNSLSGPTYQQHQNPDDDDDVDDNDDDGDDDDGGCWRVFQCPQGQLTTPEFDQSGGSDITLVTEMEKPEIEQMPCHHHHAGAWPDLPG